MSGGFNNDIIGGASDLIRAAIRSPNYVPGESGWTINRDGSAEFRTIVLPSGVGGTVVTIGATAPSAPHTGDLWLNTSEGLELSQWNGSAWVAYQYGTQAIADNAITSALIAAGAVGTSEIADGAVTNALLAASSVAAENIQDGAITAAQINAAAGILGSQLASNAGITAGQVAFTARDIGGITTTVGTTTPPAPNTGDLWFNGNNGYQLQTWNGSAWVAYQYGTQAIAAGSITAALIAAGTITATQIASGTITGANIAAGTITGNLIAANAITSGLIAAGAVTAEQIAAGTVVAGIVNGTTIQGASIVADGTSGEIVVYSGTPASGNLIASLSGAAGTDAHGNTYPAGLWVRGGNVTVQGNGTANYTGLELPSGAPSEQNPAFLSSAVFTATSGSPYLSAVLGSAVMSGYVNTVQVAVSSESADGTQGAAGLLLYGPQGNQSTVAYWDGQGVHITVGNPWVSVGTTSWWSPRGGTYPPFRVRKMAEEGTLWVQGVITSGSTTINNGGTVATFGTGYYNSTYTQTIAAQKWTGSAVIATGELHLEVSTSGVVTIWGISTSGTLGIAFNEIIYLNG